MDGTFLTPGCQCTNECECPCWQMLGMDNGADWKCGMCGCDKANETHIEREQQ